MRRVHQSVTWSSWPRRPFGALPGPRFADLDCHPASLAARSPPGIRRNPQRQHTFPRPEAANTRPSPTAMRHPGGSTGRPGLLETKPLTPGDRFIVQVSRWDRLKDSVGVIAGFTGHIADRTDAHLVIAGPAATRSPTTPREPRCSARQGRIAPAAEAASVELGIDKIAAGLPRAVSGLTTEHLS